MVDFVDADVDIFDVTRRMVPLHAAAGLGGVATARSLEDRLTIAADRGNDVGQDTDILRSTSCGRAVVRRKLRLWMP